MGKGPGKGNNKGNGKNGKGVPRHLPLLRPLRAQNQRVPDKTNADMKGKDKGQDMTWFPPVPNKGKGKGQKGFWKGGKGKGVYAVDDDWSAGYSG